MPRTERTTSSASPASGLSAKANAATAAAKSTKPDANTRILAGFRILLGALWISNLGWKEPPEFGALKGFTSLAVSNPVWAPYSSLVENVVLPNFTLFGWFTLLAEAALGAFLLIGLGTRFWALVGAGMSAAITLSVIKAPHEWPWAYYLMIGAHLAVFAAAAGRTWGLDGLVRPVLEQRQGRIAKLLRKAV